MTKEQATQEWNQWMKEFIPKASGVILCGLIISEKPEAWWLLFPAVYLYYKVNKLNFWDKKKREIAYYKD